VYYMCPSTSYSRPAIFYVLLLHEKFFKSKSLLRFIVVRVGAFLDLGDRSGFSVTDHGTNINLLSLTINDSL
jgi:hypothetical protein